jgi:hypothetical protein
MCVDFYPNNPSTCGILFSSNSAVKIRLSRTGPTILLQQNALLLGFIDPVLRVLPQKLVTTLLNIFGRNLILWIIFRCVNVLRPQVFVYKFIDFIYFFFSQIDKYFSTALIIPN